jgi:pimeloyl-ACP methyl ester carboxylesterase
MYQAKRISRSEFVPIRHLSYHVRVWGEPCPGQPPLVLLHGWMDVAASYQFVVDAFARDQHIIAPDWRGYGETDPGLADNFWFPDYLADLDFLLDHYAPGQAVDLVGHSMGANVAMLYAGVRPARVRRVVSLEGFGMPATRAAQAPGRYARWMDDLKKLHGGDMDLKSYDTMAGVTRRLMRTNPRLDPHQADWLAPHWARANAEGQWEILGNPAHKIINAQLYRVDEALEIFKRITAPLLAVQASDSSMDQLWQGRYSLAEYHERLKAVPTVEIALIDNAGHMLHHDQPAAVAALIERFLASHDEERQ